jgi:two-component system sensor histidine kinase ChiS
VLPKGIGIFGWGLYFTIQMVIQNYPLPISEIVRLRALLHVPPMWLGSDNGLYQYNINTHELILYGEEHGLENGTIRTIIEDNRGMLWVGHKRGISSFDRATKTFTNYTRYQGHPLGEINPHASLLTSSGDLLFGSTKGLYIVDPEKLQNNIYQSKIKITELKVLARPVRINDGTNILHRAIDRTPRIELSHHERMFTFNFSALNFRHATTNRYSYYLEGFDKEWIHIGQQRSATYTNLNPGTYSFMVKASNVGLDWDSEPAVIQISICRRHGKQRGHIHSIPSLLHYWYGLFLC